MWKEYEELLEHVSGLAIIDSHEHLPGREALRNRNTDFLAECIPEYIGCDLVSAGLKQSKLAYVMDASKPLMQRWKEVEPYWQFVRHTGYGRVLDLVAKAIYGADRIDKDSIQWLNTQFQKTLEPGQNQYRKVLKDLCNIEYGILDMDIDCDPAFFKSVYRINPLIYPENWLQIAQMEEETGITVCSLEDWLELCDRAVDDALQRGAVALKCSIAYFRSLSFENATRQEAEEGFHQILEKRGHNRWEPGAVFVTKAFGDYMMHYILRKANRLGLVVQIHTGLQSGNSNKIAQSDPTLLANLFTKYPNVKFDLFHLGYPYQHVLSALGKTFPNVYLNMCWGHIISPAASMHTLNEWLDSVPLNKIIAFGGDNHTVDTVYAHLLMARQNVSRVLAGKVRDGIFDMDTAKWIAERLFYYNPKDLYEGQK